MIEQGFREMTRTTEQGKININSNKRQQSVNSLLPALAPEPENVRIAPRISCPGCKSFDEFIDIEVSKPGDGFITECIKQYYER